MIARTRKTCAVFIGLAALAWRVQEVRAQSGGWATGGPEGGTVNVLAVDPQNPSTIYAGTVDNGIFKSTNGGDRWNAVNAGLGDFYVRKLAIDPQTTSTLYVGASTGGVFKSVDAGDTWSAVNIGLDYLNNSVSALAIDARNPSTLYAGTSSRGLFKSTNGGVNWFTVSGGLPDLRVSALAIDPQTTTTLYVGTPQGVFKSVDGGAGWTSTGLTMWPQSLAVDPRTPTTLYAGMTLGAGRSGVFKSIDGGVAWTRFTSGLPDASIPALIFDPQSSAVLYAGTDRYGAYTSTDGGVTWSALNTGLTNPQVLSMAVDPQIGNVLYAATKSDQIASWKNGSGVYKSTDGGANWAGIWSGLYATAVYSVAIDPQNTVTMYAGTYSGIYKSSDGGGSWSASNTGLVAPGSRSLAIDPQTTGTVYAGTNGAGVFKTTDGGAQWARVTGLGLISAFDLEFDPQNAATLYAATTTNGIFKTVDAGATWTAINTGLTSRDVRAFAIDPQTTATLYAGTGNFDPRGFAGVFKSVDGGASWTGVGLAGVAVSALAIDPRTPSIIYAASDASSLADGTGVYKSVDGGASWTAANDGLTTRTVTSLAIDAQNPNQLFAGTAGGGVFASSDGAVTWSAMDATPNPFVRALTLARDGSRLHAGTGGGVSSTSLTSAEAALTVDKTGAGDGTVTSSPAGIDCGADCSESYAPATVVTLTAVPAPGSIFAGWSRCDGVDGATCTVTMTAAVSVGARFDRQQFTLTASRSGLGTGTITSSPAGIDCGADCSEAYVAGTVVTLTAAPALGSIFLDWSGCDAVSDTRCSVSMNSNRVATARFLGIPFVVSTMFVVTR